MHKYFDLQNYSGLMFLNTAFYLICLYICWRYLCSKHVFGVWFSFLPSLDIFSVQCFLQILVEVKVLGQTLHVLKQWLGKAQTCSV